MVNVGNSFERKENMAADSLKKKPSGREVKVKQRKEEIFNFVEGKGETKDNNEEEENNNDRSSKRKDSNISSDASTFVSPFLPPSLEHNSSTSKLSSVIVSTVSDPLSSSISITGSGSTAPDPLSSFKSMEEKYPLSSHYMNTRPSTKQERLKRAQKFLQRRRKCSSKK